MRNVTGADAHGRDRYEGADDTRRTRGDNSRHLVQDSGAAHPAKPVPDTSGPLKIRHAPGPGS
ncbi:hypothetical protein [Streptomyces sp. NBC_00076]|uniref:hypothetical protein n=1 Tax=Streptomyces sp. NBC_00076 TaxID=2975642 RepID=UPI00324ED1B9